MKKTLFATTAVALIVSCAPANAWSWGSLWSDFRSAAAASNGHPLSRAHGNSYVGGGTYVGSYGYDRSNPNPRRSFWESPSRVEKAQDRVTKGHKKQAKKSKKRK